MEVVHQQVHSNSDVVMLEAFVELMWNDPTELAEEHLDELIVYS